MIILNFKSQDFNETKADFVLHTNTNPLFFKIRFVFLNGTFDKMLISLELFVIWPCRETSNATFKQETLKLRKHVLLSLLPTFFSICFCYLVNKQVLEYNVALFGCILLHSKEILSNSLYLLRRMDDIVTYEHFFHKMSFVDIRCLWTTLYYLYKRLNQNVTV